MPARVVALRFVGRLAVFLAFSCGCSDFQGPASLKSSPYDREELIPYRPLERPDFKAKEARGRTPLDQEHLAAQTCAKIVVRPDEPVTEALVEGNRRTFVAHLDAPIFFATFDRNCSSWNPASTRPVEEVLEHEQTHFALTELAARRLNAERDDIARRVRQVGTTDREVSGRAYAELGKVLQAAQDELMVRQTSFDKDVFAGGREPQRRWYRKAMAELDATSSLARGPQVALARAAATLPAGAPAATTALAPAPAAAPPHAPTPVPSSPLRSPSVSPSRPVSNVGHPPAPVVPTGSFPVD